MEGHVSLFREDAQAWQQVLVLRESHLLTSLNILPTSAATSTNNHQQYIEDGYKPTYDRSARSQVEPSTGRTPLHPQ